MILPAPQHNNGGNTSCPSLDGFIQQELILQPTLLGASTLPPFSLAISMLARMSYGRLQQLCACSHRQHHNSGLTWYISSNRCINLEDGAGGGSSWRVALYLRHKISREILRWRAEWSEAPNKCFSAAGPHDDTFVVCFCRLCPQHSA